MSQLKQYSWLVLRFCVLGPLCVVTVLGEWAEKACNYLDPYLWPNDLED